MLAAYLAVTLCLILAVGVTVIAICFFNIRATTEQDARRVLSAAADMIGEQDALSVTDGTVSLSAEAEEHIDLLSSASGDLIEILSNNDDQRYYKNAIWAGAFGQLTVDEAVSRLGTDMMKRNWFSSGGIYSITVGETIVSGDAVAGILLVHADASRETDFLQGSFAAMLLVMLIGGLVGTITVFQTTTNMVRPFLQINETVSKYSKGDFSLRIPASGISEAAHLARSFNAMADQLNDLEATRRSFVSNVSHELRSPLTSMGGFLEAMQDGTIPQEEFPKYLDIVVSENHRMAAMVNDLLDLARIESGKTVMKPEVFEINELIRRTLLTFEARIYDRKMDVDVKFAQEQYYVEADPAQISQVLRNLIDNAIKYTQEEGKLRLATYTMRSLVYVAVQDNGIGIPDEDIPYVFDRFYKVEKAHTPSKQSGTGLGLAITKKIIDAHGQNISVQSVRGKGTTFTFTLKRAESPQKKQQQQIIPEEGAKYGI